MESGLKRLYGNHSYNNKMTKNTESYTYVLGERAKGAFLGAAIGDAMGWPNESIFRVVSKSKEIIDKLPIGLNEWIRRAGGRYFAHEESICIGEYSDDTQLLLSTARSLLKGRQWCSSFTSVELPTWLLYQRGAGAATKRAAKTWLSGTKPWQYPENSKRFFQAGGNGVAMRIMPHSLINAQNDDFRSIAKEIVTNGLCTHGHPRALVGALAYGYAMWNIFRKTGTFSYGEIINDVISNVNTWSDIPEIEEILPSWPSKSLESFVAVWHDVVKEMIHLLNISQNAMNKGALSVDREVFSQIGCFDKKISGAGTIAAAASIFLASRFAADPYHGLIEAAYAKGADTDTIASMTGALLGGIHGVGWLSELALKVQDTECLLDISKHLVDFQNQTVITWQNKSKVTKKIMDRFREQLYESVIGQHLVLPDGRDVTVKKRKHLKSISRTTEVISWKLITNDKQTLYVKRINRVTKKEDLEANDNLFRINSNLLNSANTSDVEYKSLVHKIDYKSFLRSFEIRPMESLGLFLGAGASVQAGIPTGGALIWEFKRKLYCQDNERKEERFKDIESERNRTIIQSYFDSKTGYPKLYSKEEYPFYFEKCYPHSIDRKLFIQKKVENIKPSLGHKCLGALVNNGKIKHIWTTNFDELIESGIKEINSGLSIEVYSSDNAHQTLKPESEYPKVIKLHGDYRYDPLRNTTEELRKLEADLLGYFTRISSQTGLVVAGYGGNDDSVMTALSDVLLKENHFPYGFYWCLRKGETPSDELINLVNEVNKKDKMSGFIEIDNFDAFLYDLYSSCKLKNTLIENMADNLFRKRMPFRAPQANKNSETLLLNAIKVTLFPKTLYSFSSKLSGWKELKELIKNKEVVGGLHKGKTYVFGDEEKIKKVFNGKTTSKIELSDVDNRWLSYKDSFFSSMLYDLIDYSLQKHYGLKRASIKQNKYFSENHRLSNQARLKLRKIPSHYVIYEAFEYQIDFYDDNLYFIILPTVHVIDKRTEEMAQHSKYEMRNIANKVISNRYNATVGEKLKFWRGFLKGDRQSILFSISNFRVELSPSFSFAGYKINDQINFWEGLFSAPEPFIEFSITDKKYKTVHPLKGLKAYGPFDYSFENININLPAIKLGIIAPDSGFQRIVHHLNGLNDDMQVKSEKEYLIDYQQFSSIYKRFLDIPKSKESKYVQLVNKFGDVSILDFYEKIKRKIDYFYSIRGEFDVLVLFFSLEWQRYRELKNEAIYFDFHDSIKIYCAKKNIKIQIIEDKSINYFDQAKVRWWLSLGLYVKANGTPWKSQATIENTAYIGLSYAVKGGSIDNKVVIGSSQIFDSSGQGLRFMLQPIERPVFYGKNPFMSKEDARRLILKLREAYFKMDPNSRLERLVIHKTTHFTREEMEGIAQALEGIDNIELLQIQKFTFWRGIRGDLRKQVPHGFPIQRGTTLQLDDYNFLLWTHGSVCHPDVAGKMNYYQGKRGIPVPLVVRRFRGKDTIETLTKEILALTKMNWNGGELYRTLPVTLEFSKVLSSMSKQVESLKDIPYDFRFFM